MTPDQIKLLVESGESEVVEFKKSTGQRTDAAAALCAMLNHRGGRVLFGVADDGRVVGQQVTDGTMRKVAQELERMDPPAQPVIDPPVEVGPGKQVLVVSVPQGPVRPYTYKLQAYKKNGPTTVKMSREEYNQMLLERLHAQQRWENQPAEGGSVADLDAAEITRTIDEAIRRGRQNEPETRNPLELLRGFKLVKDGHVLRAAMVLFGRAERLEAEMPQCLLRMARFRGSDKSEFVDNRQYHGNAFQMLTQAERFLRDHLPVAGRIVPGLFEREDDPQYPPEALREALANAICHRDYGIGGGSVAVAIYDNRLEITSSGTLHFGLTVQDLFQQHESLPWNPLVARVFYQRGIIEQWGRGTLKMVELTRKAGLPRPEIETAGGCVTVRLRPNIYIAPERVEDDLSREQQWILTLLGQKGKLAVRHIQVIMNATFGQRTPKREIRADLTALKGLGLVDSHGHGRGAYWFLADEVRDR